jgi:hypothetical protein
MALLSFLFFFGCISLSAAIECPVGYTVIQTCHLTPSSLSSNSEPSQPTSISELNWLSLLNSYRSKHHVPPLKNSKELQIDAQNTANKCSMSATSSDFGKISYIEYTTSPLSPGSVTPTNDILSNAISSWYNTINQYDFSNPQFDSKTGHATQLLWKSTTNVGCFVSLCKSQSTSRLIVTFSAEEFFFFAVCSFSPPGNVKGMFEENILPI